MNNWSLKLKTQYRLYLHQKERKKQRQTDLGINLTKYVQDLYEANYDTLMEEIKKDLNKWKDIPCI